ncbi:hypothetical protein B5726_11360 [Lactiplantibacillus plantarum]|nr:hypothetical protein B5726_11360 [Lactiplantibacillus plantarum]
MQTVFLVLLLVAAVVVANAVYARFNQIPVAFLQIGAGLILSLIPLYRNFELEPEIFLFVIISILMTNCQIKRNFVPKKTSNGLFQPKTLRGR